MRGNAPAFLGLMNLAYNSESNKFAYTGEKDFKMKLGDTERVIMKVGESFVIGDSMYDTIIGRTKGLSDDYFDKASGSKFTIFEKFSDWQEKWYATIAAWWYSETR